MKKEGKLLLLILLTVLISSFVYGVLDITGTRSRVVQILMSSN